MQTYLSISLFPMLRPAFRRLLAGEGLVLFSRDIRIEKDGRKGLIMRGRNGPRTAKRAKVPGRLPQVYS